MSDRNQQADGVINDDDDETQEEGHESGDEEVLDELAASTSEPLVDSDAIDDATALPDELTGRADATDEDLTALFRNNSGGHFSDGFAGSGDEDTDHVSQNDGESEPDATGHERKGI